MSEIVFRSASPIGDTDTNALPVESVAAAVAFYTNALGFTQVSQEGKRAELRRGDAVIGLEENDSDPEQASVYFGVSDVETLRAELEAKGLEPTPIRVDEYGGNRYRVFFAKEPCGVCFCFGEPA